MMIGPLRAAAVLDGRKLILFNPRTPYTPANELEAYLWTQDLDRLQRVELYDLARTPASGAISRRSAAAAEIARLQPIVHRQLDRELPGCASSPPASRRLAAPGVDRSSTAPPPAGTPTSWRRGPRRAGRQPGELRSRRRDPGEGLPPRGGRRRRPAVEARLDGRPLAAGQLLRRARRALCRRRRWLPRPSPPNSLPPRRRPPPLAPRAGGARRRHPNPETERRLRALGYIQ